MVDAKQAVSMLALLLAAGRLGLAEDALLPLPKEILQEETIKNDAAPCVQPPRLLGWDDYQGPFQEVVGTFARNLDRGTAQVRHYRPDAVLCSLMLKDKFMAFVGDTKDPKAFLSSAFNAALDQAAHRDPTFGQGMAGYGKRFNSDFASQTTARFIMDFAYPTIFREDPRYYRLGHGAAQTRLFHALEHSVVAHRDNGTQMFNFTEWLGTTTAVVVNDEYHPGNPRGFRPTAEAVAFSLGTDMGFDVLREFWPEIAHKFRMPFRDRESFIAK
jgi:hypothetical protein